MADLDPVLRFAVYLFIMLVACGIAWGLLLVTSWLLDTLCNCGRKSAD